MTNIQNIKVLASIAHEAGNYEESYKYNSQILEVDISDADAWIKKGIAAIYISDLAGDRLNEAKVLIKHGIDQKIDDALMSQIVRSIDKGYDHFISKLDAQLLEKVKDHQKIGMPVNGSAIIHALGQQVNKIAVAKQQSESRLKAIRLFEIINQIETSKSYKFKFAEKIDKALKNSKELGDYFPPIAISEISRIKSDMEEYIKPKKDDIETKVEINNSNFIAEEMEDKPSLFNGLARVIISLAGLFIVGFIAWHAIGKNVLVSMIAIVAFIAVAARAFLSIMLGIAEIESVSKNKQ